MGAQAAHRSAPGRPRVSYRARRIRRHVVLGLVSVALTGGVAYILAADPFVYRLSMGSAYAGLGLMAVTLLVGPWNVLRNRPNPVSTNLRRDIGIWAGILGLFHVVVGLQVHMGGQILLYFLPPPDAPRRLPIRLDRFGIANYTGLGVTLVLALLLLLSNDRSLRSLGPRRWKALQRWNYAAFGLVVVHGAVYQLLERRRLLFIGVFALVVVAVVAAQAAAIRRIAARGGCLSA